MTTPAKQSAFRDEYRRRIESWYHGWMHVAAIYGIGGVAMWWFIGRIEGPVFWYQWAAILPVLLVANMLEWAMHLFVMHRPRKNPIARAIYRRHTLMHHQFFTEHNYRIDSVRDFRIVFFPPYTYVAALVLAAPGSTVLGFVLGANAGWLSMCTVASLYMIYEFFHFCCHVGDNWFVRNTPFINTIRRHHIAHHEQAIMMDRNMNLTFPISDWLFGTSDLDRGLIGTLLNGYSTRHVRKDMARKSRQPSLEGVQLHKPSA